jgi:PAS domain S-box-containing protein
MRVGLPRGQLVAITLLLAALLIDAVLALHNIRAVAIAGQWVCHSQEVLGKLEEAISTLKDGETGQHGYLLTGERGYLEPYEQAVTRLQGQFEELRQLTSDSPGQAARARRLEQLASGRMTMLHQSLGHFQADPDRALALQAARQRALFDEGKDAMDTIRREMQAMQEVERELLERREAAAHAKARTALANTVIALGLGLLLIMVVGWLSVRDLATRKRTADVLRGERGRLRATLTGIGDAVVATDAHGRITLLNAAARALTRMGDEAVGRPLGAVFRVVDASTREAVESPVSKIVRLGAAVDLPGHTVLIARDGTEVPIDGTGAPIRGARGRIAGAVLVLRDVTAPRRSAHAPEDADRHNDELLALLAHELRTPLAPLRTAAHTLALLGGGDDRVRWVSGIIERQVGLMARLADDLLDLSRITSGKLTLRKERVSVRALLARVIETARPDAESRRQTLELDASADVGWVDGDPKRLAQAVGTLLDNALKDTNDGGRVRLIARNEAVEVVIAVQDTGAGIHPDRLPHVFDPFSQDGPSPGRKQGGLGIGLTLVRRLVEMHGGRVGAASEGPGLGSEFTIRLPRLAPDGAKPAAETEASAGSRPAPHILVGDNEPGTTGNAGG